MNEINRSSIKNIYSNYFDIIDSYFGSIKHYLGKEKDSHIELGIQIARYPLISDLILDSIEDLNEEINKFWNDNVLIVYDYIKNVDTLKCIYSGDISPIILEDFVKKSCLYVDSVVIPDPIYNLTIVQKQIVFDNKYYLSKIIRHVFNVWKLKELVLADTKENILLILPVNLHLVNSNEANLLVENANNKFIEYLSSIVNYKFESLNDSFGFLEKIETTESIYSNFKNINALPTFFQDFKFLNSFLNNFGNTNKYTAFKNKTIGWNFGFYLQSQFIRVQEHKFFCDILKAEPIYDNELPWFFFNYEMGCAGIDEAIINSLQKERFEWITEVPLPALKILREQNKLEYIRNILRKGITDLKAKNDEDLINTSEQIENNLKEAFKQQESDIQFLEKEVSRIIKKDIPITTTALLAGFIPYIGSVISIFFAGRDIKNQIKKRNFSKNQLSDKKVNFINLLMKSYAKK